jgi:hypothetical protein
VVNAAPDWTPQLGYTDGAPMLFWDGRELIELKMVVDSLSGAAAAAETLNARFFFRRVGWDGEAGKYIWGAFDRNDFKRGGGTTTFDPTPLKTFKTNSTDPLIMWAAAKGGR